MKTQEPGSFVPLGFYPHGDFGPYTIYTNKHRKVVRFLRAPPTTPPTWLQRRQRNAWAAVATSWSTMGKPGRDWWNAVAALNHLTISGYNLYVHFWTGRGATTLVALTTPGPMP